MTSTLTKSNSPVKRAPESGNFYIHHPDFRTPLRFYADEEELKADKDFRKRIALREGDGFYCVLCKSALEDTDY